MHEEEARLDVATIDRSELNMEKPDQTVRSVKLRGHAEQFNFESGGSYFPSFGVLETIEREAFVS